MPEIMTTQDMAKYLKLHEITICKLAGEGTIPAKRIGRVWRFDKEAVDQWISNGQISVKKKARRSDPGSIRRNSAKGRKKGKKIATKSAAEIEDDNQLHVAHKLR